jgi:hypothetical protein
LTKEQASLARTPVFLLKGGTTTVGIHSAKQMDKPKCLSFCGLKKLILTNNYHQ